MASLGLGVAQHGAFGWFHLHLSAVFPSSRQKKGFWRRKRREDDCFPALLYYKFSSAYKAVSVYSLHVRAKIKHVVKFENRFLLTCTKFGALRGCSHYKWCTQKKYFQTNVKTYMTFVILKSFFFLELHTLCTVCRRVFCIFMASHTLIRSILYP